MVRKWIRQNKKREEAVVYPPIHITTNQLRKAIHEFTMHLPKGINRSVLVKEDHRIDYEALKPYLKGIPIEQYYMSKETYEIFEERDKMIPVYTDIVQKAVDTYVQDQKELPVISGDPYRKVNYHLLLTNSYLKEKPPIDFYISDMEFMVTHRNPKVD